MSPSLMGRMVMLCPQCVPKMALQVRLLAPNSYETTSPSHSRMYGPFNRSSGLRLRVSSNRPAWTSSGGPGNAKYGLRRVLKK